MKDVAVVVTKCSFMRKVMEADCEKSSNWRLIHNTSKSSDGESRKVCTHTYQLFIHDKPTGCIVKFYYDYRVDEAQMFFDVVGEKVLAHMAKGDYDPDKIKDYIDRKAVYNA